MLDGVSVIQQVIGRYPVELREQLRADLEMLVRRDRGWVISQVQFLLSESCCAEVEGMRREVDKLLNPDAADF